jgi:DNA-binding transcriptional ArsR family regulator
MCEGMHGMSQPTISHYLSILKQFGFADPYKRGGGER